MAPQQEASHVAQQSNEGAKGALLQPVFGGVVVLAAGNEILISTDEGDYEVFSLSTAGDLTVTRGRTIKAVATLVSDVVGQNGYRVIDVLEISPAEWTE